MKTAFTCPALYAVDDSASAIWGIALLVAVIVIVFSAAYMAFTTGQRPTPLGLTGHAWGWIIVVFSVMLPPLGMPLSVLYLVAGRSAGGGACR